MAVYGYRAARVPHYDLVAATLSTLGRVYIDDNTLVRRNHTRAGVTVKIDALVVAPSPYAEGIRNVPGYRLSDAPKRISEPQRIVSTSGARRARADRR